MAQGDEVPMVLSEMKELRAALETSLASTMGGLQEILADQHRAVLSRLDSMDEALDANSQRLAALEAHVMRDA